MKLPEKILLGLSFISILLRVFLVPGGAIASILSLGFLSFYYFGAGFWAFSYGSKKAGTKENMLGISIPVGIFYSIGVMGILFRLLFWPGGFLYLGVCFIVLFIFLILAIVLICIKKYNASHKIYLRRLIIRLAIIVVLTNTLYFVSNKTMFGFFHRDDPKLVKLYNATIDDPNNMEKLMEYEDYFYDPRRVH